MTYINPRWRYYHGDNHDLGYHALSPSDTDPGSWTLVTCRQCKTVVRPEWFGLPKPDVQSLTQRLNERFMHARNHAWDVALGPEPHGVLAAMQSSMPEWPHLFAFHAFTVAWALLPSDDERSIYMDLWEQTFIRGACDGRECGGWPR